MYLWKKLRTILRRLTEASGSQATGTALDFYSKEAPSAQNALKLFEGEWSSMLPAPLDELDAGMAPLFDDPRLAWGIERVGGVAGKRVLELGPLEGGHTYMLEKAGAAEILAIEANSRAFLKCLIVKELLRTSVSTFMLGDFMVYLETEATSRFDLAVASGVLYHMVDPVGLLSKLSAKTDAIYLWTHYYDAQILAVNPDLAHRVVEPLYSTFGSFRYELYRHEYQQGLAKPGFCGGSQPHSYWMTREGILGAISYLGFVTIETHYEQPLHPHGPALCVLARR